MKGYKAFNNDMTCRGFQYEVGKTYEIAEKPIPCKQGFHFCKSIAECYRFYGMSDDTRICEVEAVGEIATDDNIKYCTNKIRIVSEITEDWVRRGNANSSNNGYCNTGDSNTGDSNTGNRNTGDRNTGNRNTGNRNTGDRNTGDRNIGNCNTGDRNTGYGNTGNCNTGDWNTGDRNIGDWNTGDLNIGNWNTGDRNTGNRNIGNWNTGNCNTGDRNTGDWNTTNFSSGCFCTEKQHIQMFDEESKWTYEDWLFSDARRILKTIPYTKTILVLSEEMSEKEKEEHPDYKTTGGYLKECKATSEEKQKWWDSLPEEDKEKIKQLPNFDEEKFCKCTGIVHI